MTKSKIKIHAIADGRDVSPRSIEKYLQKIFQKKIGKVASVCGRFFAMDRDENWARTEKYFQLLTKKIGTAANLNSDFAKFSAQISAAKIDSDYFLPPFFDEKNFAKIEKNDAVLFFNFRSDCAAQISTAFCDPDFKKFPRSRIESGMTFKKSEMKFGKKNFFIFGPFCKFATNIFPPEKVKNNLAEVLAKNSKTQLRLAETEKFAHATFFFNSQKKEKNRGEKWILIPSKKCRSFAEFPEMSAREIAKKLRENLSENFDFIFVNFANADLVGHSGDFAATKKSCEILDEVLAEIIPAARAADFQILVSADHGNADEMVDSAGEIQAAHSKAAAPLIFCGDENLSKKFRENLATRKPRGEIFGVKFFGELADVAPTILKILEIPKPVEMMGESFF
jgi:2,3-bisphosphoglycerate-independent phosphoglycerate mutase